MTKTNLFVPRTYRHWTKGTDLVSFTVMVQETDLFIRAASNLSSKATKLVEKYRRSLESYIERHTDFLTSLEPIKVNGNAPLIVKAMANASARVNVGPMAAVAGAIAEFVGKELLDYTPEIIIENGGDIFIKSLKKRVIGIYAGDSPLTGKIGLEIEAAETPLGVCTSSGTVGHSLSFGKTDATIVLAKSAAMADAAATALGNVVKQPGDIETALEFAKSISDIKGAVVILGDKMGVWGDVKIISM